MKFGRVVFEICELTDRWANKQTDRHTDTLIAIPAYTGGEVIMDYPAAEVLLDKNVAVACVTSCGE